MHIRVATMKDLDAISQLSAQIQRDQYRSEPDLFLTPDQVSDEEYRHYWKQVLNGRENRIFVAEQEGRIVGYVSAHILRFEMPFMIKKIWGV
jgi:hypothetical protein